MIFARGGLLGQWKIIWTRGLAHFEQPGPRGLM